LIYATYSLRHRIVSAKMFIDSTGVCFKHDDADFKGRRDMEISAHRDAKRGHGAWQADFY
jgi:hypothetical protein